jgi:hypothetical protein
MNTAELIYQEAKDLPDALRQEVLELIRQLKAQQQKDYEEAKSQALAMLDNPPFDLNGRYGSRDSLYDRL